MSPIRGWSGSIYQICEACVRSSLGNSRPVMVLDYQQQNASPVMICALGLERTP